MFRKRKVNMKRAKLKLIEDKISSIVIKLLENDVDIFNAPNSDEYFLVDVEKGINIGIEHTKIKVANHNYTYSEPLSLKFIEKLKYRVKEALEIKTQGLKKQLFKNEIDLLNKITKIYIE